MRQRGLVIRFNARHGRLSPLRLTGLPSGPRGGVRMEVLGHGLPHLGRYRLLAELGRGGMGRVLLAAGPDGRLVAVNRIHTRFAGDATSPPGSGAR